MKLNLSLKFYSKPLKKEIQLVEKTILNYRIKLEKISNSKVENEHQIHSLSPLNNLDEGEGRESYERYENRLISALNEESIFNIAVTGIYGSGKSSVLNTFKKKYKENSQWDFLDISLSSFQINKDTFSDDKDSNAIDEKNSDIKIEGELTPEQIQLIERSILQQFFYAVPQNKIPLSRFKRITGNALTNKVIALLVITLIISGLVFFDKVGYIEAIYSLPDWLPKLAFWCFLICFILLLYKLLSVSFELSEIKLNFHNSEFNIKNEKEKSILNDHLDEILYFFEATGKNVVIIEDLDRFNNNEIFVRLRELNSMINKYCEDRVVFLYAIKDDMFTDTERSKFFEYIIPVIPIINPTNAYDLIQKSYEKVVEDIDKRFLRNTCLYFDDMRLLKNILNEYQTYFDQLKALNIDKNKLFAIVVYKNYYPNEFAKLNSNRGEIYDVFHTKKDDAIEGLLKEKREGIDGLKIKKENVLKESLKSIDELNSVYAYAVLNKLVGTFNDVNYSRKLIQVQAKGKNYNVNEIADTEVLRIFSQYQDIILHITNTGFRKELKFSDIENEVNPDESYLDRLINVEAKKDGKLESIFNEEANLKDEIQNIKRMKLEEILKDTSITIDKPLLRYFVTNGFIDETYQDYISYFFEESISLKDKNYAILVNAFNEPNFELKLKKCGELVETYLGLDKLSTQSALNFSMLDYLLTQPSKKTYLESYIKIICDGSSISVEFLKFYFKREENLSILTPEIVDLRESVIDDLGISGNTEESLFNFKNFIKYIPLNRYQEFAYLTEEFRRKLSFMEDYVSFVLECFDGDFDKFKAFTDAVKPVLECANFSLEQVEELNWLGEYGYLATNKHMIKQILVNNLEDSDTAVADLEVKPVTLMANSGIDYLTQNLWSENISEYIKVVLLDADENTSYFEDEDIYIKALNGLDDCNSITERFIDLNSTKIKDISAVKNYQIQKYLIGSLKVQYLWSNVFKYFSESYEDQDDQGAYREIDGSLVKFLENGQSYLQTINCTESDILDIEDWEDTKAEFDKNLFLCSELSDEAYKKLIDITDNNWDNSNLEDISQEKVQTLISLGKLSLTSENWEQVKEHASKEVVLAFLVKYHYTLIHDLDIIELRPEDIEELFCSNEVSNAHKKVLAESKAINLIESNETVRKKIIEIYENERMSLPVYEQLLKHANFKELRELLLRQIKYLDKYEILKVLELLDVPYQKLAKGEDVEFNNSEENRTLLKALHNAQIVVKIPKAKRPKGNLKGQKVLTTRLQLHVLGN